MGGDPKSWNTSSNKHIFYPPDDVKPKDMMVYDPENGITHTKFRDGSADKSTIVIATDGSHRMERPGQLGLISSYGVYFGPNSPYNQGALLPFSEKQDCNSAEYYAARVAIDFVINHIWGKGHCFPVDKIVILTDSANMVDNIKKLRETGRMKEKKGIPSFDILFIIDRMMGELCEQSREFRFWNVLRCHNTDADHLATQGYTQWGLSSSEHTIDRPWKEWALANKLHKTPEERERSMATMRRITSPLVPQDNKHTASIAGFLITRWALNEEYRKEFSLAKMGNIFGPKYREVFIQEQVNTETKIGQIQHEIT